MPHIHTEPGQHDVTASAWIIRVDGDEPLVLVHMHRKLNKLMQVGGHIELDETPWQTLAHELVEEAGYGLAELQVLQPFQDVPAISSANVHPVPVVSNTHLVGDGHYHSDYGYAFIARDVPAKLPAEGESEDLRWLTIDELQQAATEGDALQDVVDIYRFVVEKIVPTYHRIDAAAYELSKPSISLLASK